VALKLKPISNYTQTSRPIACSIKHVSLNDGVKIGIWQTRSNGKWIKNQPLKFHNHSILQINRLPSDTIEIQAAMMLEKNIK
jgi:hypothetical protein